MINALEVSVDINLATFSRFLTDSGLPHRVTEAGLNQVVWVAGEAEAGFVRESYLRYTAGELQIGDLPEGIPRFQLSRRLLQAARRYPLTLAVIVLNMLMFPVGMGIGGDKPGALFSAMMFLPMEEAGGSLYFISLAEVFYSGEWWRFITPMLIHFGWLHIAFNLLWVWEMGRRIEWVNGPLMLLGLVLFSSLGANFTQFFMSGPGLFGGMSGVVFGLLGHSLVWSRLVPHRSTSLPKGVYIFMLIYLAVGFTGAIDLLGLGSIANGAHLGGMVAGVITGGVAGLFVRRKAGTNRL